MAVGTEARQYNYQVPHQVARKFTISDYGNGDIVVGQVPPCIITRIATVKTADFNAGSTAIIEIGLNQIDGSTEDEDDIFLASYDVTSGTTLGIIDHSAEDVADVEISNAAEITADLSGTGTAPTAGSVYVVVEYIPLSHVNS